MEAERTPLFGKRKKMKPRVVDVENGDRLADGDVNAETMPPATPVADVAEFVGSQPSAPELDSADQNPQRKLFRKLYLLLTAHVTVFTAITVLFVYVPHLRNIMRRNVFDKLLLTSYVTTPLLVFVLIYLLFPGLRRRFAVVGLVLITATLGWLLSYTISLQDARAMLVSVGSAQGCSLTTYATSFAPFLDVTSKKSLAFSPFFMLTSNAIFHSIFTRNAQAILPAVVTTTLMTHFAFNARSLVKNESLNLMPNEYCYALVQMYTSAGIYRSVKNLFRRQSYQAI